MISIDGVNAMGCAMYATVGSSGMEMELCISPTHQMLLQMDNPDPDQDSKHDTDTGQNAEFLIST